MVELADYQLKAIQELQNGSILCGGVGSGKSRTAIGYYLFRVCEGSLRVNGIGEFHPMKQPRDLYIITTAKKRDSLEWELELSNFLLTSDQDELTNVFCVKVVIDSWNNIKKYKDVHSSFFIFDEQRVVGSGVWVKTFLNIARKNQWILLSATPGDEWKDYIPVFVANGFYKNKTEFNQRHCVFSRFSKYPKIDRYVDTKQLDKNLKRILVTMEDQRHTIRHEVHLHPKFDKEKYRLVQKMHWNPWDDEPIQESGQWCYLQRRVLNEDPSRILIVDQIYQKHGRVIIFYNFDYELELLREYCEWGRIHHSEWNGHKHENIPDRKKWIYLVQYSAGAEGWNCVTSDAMIFYSQNYSYRITEQAAGRIDRMNTPFQDLYYYYLWARGGIDLAIREKLKEKRNFNASNFAKKSGF